MKNVENTRIFEIIRNIITLFTVNVFSWIRVIAQTPFCGTFEKIRKVETLQRKVKTLHYGKRKKYAKIFLLFVVFFENVKKTCFYENNQHFLP